MPTIENRFGGVLVTIQRSPLFRKLYNGEPQNDSQKLSQRQKAILLLMRDNINITRKEMANKLNVSLTTIRRDLFVLRNRKIVIYAGSSKEGHWEILRDNE